MGKPWPRIKVDIGHTPAAIWERGEGTQFIAIAGLVYVSFLSRVFRRMSPCLAHRIGAPHAKASYSGLGEHNDVRAAVKLLESGKNGVQKNNFATHYLV